MDIYVDNSLRQRYDDVNRQYTAWDSAGIIVVGPRPYTAEENATLDAKNAETTAKNNAANLTTKAKTALTNNNTFLAIVSPTNADIVAQVKALTRQVNALIKLEIQDLANTTGT